MFCRVDLIKKLCFQNHQTLFTYRIREKNDGEGYTDNSTRPVNTDKPPIPSNFRFVQNIFSLMSISNKNTLIIRNNSEILPWDNKTVKKLGMSKTIESVSSKL
jgi:hypothetical protein